MYVIKTDDSVGTDHLGQTTILHPYPLQKKDLNKLRETKNKGGYKQFYFKNKFCFIFSLFFIFFIVL